MVKPHKIGGHTIDSAKVLSIERLRHHHWTGLYGLRIHFRDGGFINIPGSGMACDNNTHRSEGWFTEETLQEMANELGIAMT